MIRFSLIHGILLSAIIISGCSTSTIAVEPSKAATKNVDYEIEYLFDTQSRTVTLTLKNTTLTPICLLHEDWPGENGEVGYGADILMIMDRDETFPIEDGSVGYPPSNLSINAGEVIRSNIPFTNFNIPESVNLSEQASLIYQPYIRFCEN